MFPFFVVLFAVVGADDFINDDVRNECKLPLKTGTTPCKTGKKEIRYYFDVKAFMPLAFEYTGCGGNANNFRGDGNCRSVCLPMDVIFCPGGKELPKPETCKEHKDCGPKGYCTEISEDAKVCCDKKTTDEHNADWKNCPKGKKPVEVIDGGIPTVIAGKSCKSKFCPPKTTCSQGTHFSICCK